MEPPKASESQCYFVARRLPFQEAMSDLKREILVNDVLERAAALSYYLLFALVPTLLCAVWLA